MMHVDQRLIWARWVRLCERSQSQNENRGTGSFDWDAIDQEEGCFEL